MLKLSDQGFKTTVITTLRVLVDKVDSMQEQMGTVRRETESLRNQKKKKNTITEVKDAFDDCINTGHG